MSKKTRQVSKAVPSVHGTGRSPLTCGCSDTTGCTSDQDVLVEQTVCGEDSAHDGSKVKRLIV